MPLFITPLCSIVLHTPGAGAAGQGTTNTKFRRYTTAVTAGTGFPVHADSSTDGGKLTVAENGLYFIDRSDGVTSGAAVNHGISLNSAQGTTVIESITFADRLALTASEFTQPCSCLVRLVAGDVIRAHDAGTVCNFTTATAFLRMIKVAY